MNKMVVDKVIKIIIFTKAPITNLAKTRLATLFNYSKAAKLSEAFLKETIALINSMQVHIVKFIYFFPEDFFEYFKSIAGNSWNILVQKGSDLGEKLFNVFKEQSINNKNNNDNIGGDVDSNCNNKIILIGSDIPTLPANLIQRAISELDKCEIVIGPAYDGGFYLLGAKKISRKIFSNVRWSTIYTLSDLLANVNKLKINYTLLPEWYDIDDVKGLKMLKKTLKLIPKDKYSNIRKILG